MNKILFVATAMLMASAPVHAGDPVAGKEKSKACAACHGEDGISKLPDFPSLAGQHGSYLERALRDYKAGTRKNPIMADQVKNLKPADIADLAAYYASRPPALQTRY
jgi:cytochrome c553